MKISPLTPLALLLLTAAAAEAQNIDETAAADLTIRLITDASATLPDAVTRQIELPAGAVNAAGPSTRGLATANAARAGEHSLSDAAGGRNGLETAAAARENGRAFGAAMATEARERAEASVGDAVDAAERVRENLGRRDSLDDLPTVPHPESPSDVSLPDVPAPVGPPGLGH